MSQLKDFFSVELQTPGGEPLPSIEYEQQRWYVGEPGQEFVVSVSMVSIEQHCLSGIRNSSTASQAVPPEWVCSSKVMPSHCCMHTANRSTTPRRTTRYASPVCLSSHIRGAERFAKRLLTLPSLRMNQGCRVQAAGCEFGTCLSMHAC